MRVVPFTTDGGLKARPALSPDGERVAYEWRKPGDATSDIYVKAVGPGTRPIRVTDHPAWDSFPAWSPDGRRIAFVRGDGDGWAIYVMPALGGQERKLADGEGPVVLFGITYFLPTLSWSPDGQTLAFAEKPLPSEPAHIVGISPDGGARRTLTAPGPLSLGDVYPSFSPDGSALAFVRGPALSNDLWIQPVAGGEARRVTFGEYGSCGRPVWAQDGSAILIACGDPIEQTTLRVGVEGGEPEPVSGLGPDSHMPSIGGDRMVYVQGWIGTSADIWRLPGRRSSPSGRRPEALITSSRSDSGAAYSPDGRRIAFQSNRTGVLNIWVSDSDGSDPVQVTSFETAAGTPRWSPDGERICFDASSRDNWDIYVIDAAGGRPVRLTRHPADDRVATWSRDGRQLYFSSERSGERQIWSVPAAGGEPRQLTTDGGLFAQESWDGEHLYFVRSDPPSLWRMPVAGGSPTQVLPDPVSGLFEWQVFEAGVYYVMWVRPGICTIRYLDFGTGETTEVFREEDPGWRWDLAVSPDETWLLFTNAGHPESELMLVENFR